MHVGVDLGFGSLAVAVVALVFGFVIRAKWLRSVARKAEIRRLLVLAAEEAARAEHEATLSYYGSLDEAAWSSSSSYTSSEASSFSSSSSRNGYQCAVCFSPTTTRCSRCKAVRYCSGKCQIIHWRQGHKEECQPFSEDFHNRENEGNHGQKVSLQEEQQVSDKRYENASVDTTSVQSISSSSTEVPYVKNEFNTGDCSADEESTCTVSESSGGSFSGFSTSPLHSGSSDDVSVVGSASSNETEGSDGRMLPTGPDMLEHRFNNVGNSHPSSPKFACLVDYLDSDNEPSVSNHSKHPSSSGSKSKHAVAGSSHQNRGPVSENSANHNDSSSGFWGRTLDSVMNSADSVDGSAGSYSKKDDVTKKSHSDSAPYSKSEPFADGHFGKEPELVSKGFSVGSKVSGALNASEATDRSTLSKKHDNKNARNSSSVSCEKPTPAGNGCNSGHSDFAKSGEHKAEPSLVDVHLSSDNKDGSSPFDPSEVCPSASTSARASFEVHDAVSKSSMSKIRISSTAAGSRLAPKEPPPVGVKSERQDSGLSGSTITPSGIATPSYVGGLKSSILKVVDQFRGPKNGRYNDKGLFSYDTFVKLYISNKVEMRPFGLVNCGNSCYANAVLQCLVFTPPLTTYFAQGLHSKTCVDKGWCFSCEIEKLISKAKEGRSPLSPIGIISQLRNIGSQLSNGREEDAHEFLRYSIDTMQSICLKEAGANSLTSLEEETTLVGLTFGGYLHSKIRCLKCNYKSERQERMMDLAVEIGGDIARLEDALRRFTSSEILDGDNKYLCSRCKSKERAKKKLTIQEAPNVLTIALKRFQSGKFGKLNKPIRFPDILNLAPYMSGTSDKSPIYGLYGVIVHVDVMNAAFSGHYVSYVKNVQNKWFKVDDSSVTSVDLERVLAKGAYMLLYSRFSPRAPRLIRNSITPPDAKTKSNPSNSNARSPVLRSRSNVANTNSQGTGESLSSHESFYLKFHRLQKIMEEDISSDSISFSSSNSDEGSCSTDSAKGSACTDELSDYIFGGYNNTWRSSSDSDASSSSSSPMYSTYSPTSTLDGYVPSPSQLRWSKMDPADSTAGDGDGRDRPKNGSRSEGKEEIDPFLHPDLIRPSRKLVSSSSCRETDSVKVGSVNPCSDVKSGLSSRRSTSGRASQWL